MSRSNCVLAVEGVNRSEAGSWFGCSFREGVLNRRLESWEDSAVVGCVGDFISLYSKSTNIITLLPISFLLSKETKQLFANGLFVFVLLIG